MWPFTKKETSPEKQLLSVSIDSEGISVVLALFSPVLDQSAKLPFVISHAEFIPCDDPSQHEFLLNKFVLNHNLQEAPCCFVLDPKEYHLFLLDAPNVQADELKKSAKWLIKDLIDFTLDDVAVDVFSSPVREGQKPKIFITATRKSYLEMVSSMFTSAGVELKKVDIVELAIRNLAMMAEGAEKGVVALYSTGNSLHIMILKGETIYLIRRVDNFFKRFMATDAVNGSTESKVKNETVLFSSEIDQKKPNNIISLLQHDQASLQFTQEIMRSIDYYQSQMVGETPVKILLDWQLGQKEDFVKCLSEQSGIPVEVMSVEKIFAFQEGLTDVVREKCFAAIGGCFYLKEQREVD